MSKYPWFVAALTVSLIVMTDMARADEGGASFWLPGQQGSLAAVPGEPGWSLPLIYYHASSDAEGSREFDIGGKIALGVEADVNLLLMVPTYIFKNPVAGGQGSISFAAVLQDVSIGANLTLSEPGGMVIEADERDSSGGIGDFFPTFTLKWNEGVHNSTWYFAAGVPTGRYTVGRLANLSTNHWSVDSGGGYTYFNPESGQEFSVVGGLTYNFENPDTDYQNGVDAHVDLAWSKFVGQKKSTHVGLAAYAYQQITGDSGAGADLGDFESRVFGLGPQVGHMFAMGGKQAYFNFRGYYEFGAEHRLEGWNTMVTLVIPLGGGGD